MGKKECACRRGPLLCCFAAKAKGMLWHGAAGPEDLFREVKDGFNARHLGARLDAATVIDIPADCA